MSRRRGAASPLCRRAHLLDKADAAEVEVLVREGLQHLLVVDALWLQDGVADQLGGAPQEGQELVVVQPPDAV